MYPQCVDITACGNFVVIGYDTGHVDRFNLQSGLARGSYGDPGKLVTGVRAPGGTRIRQVSIKFRITARQAGRDTSPPANGRPAAQDSGV